MGQGKRQEQVEFASKVAFGACAAILGILIALIIVNRVESHKSDMPWLNGTEQTALDTMRAIIPNGKGVITYEDGSADSIRWSEANEWPEEKITRGVSIDPIASDGEHMWITSDGDTIWE